MKAGHAKLSLMLKSEQEKSAQLLDDIIAFFERAVRWNKTAAKEKSKRATAEKRLTDDTATINSLKT